MAQLVLKALRDVLGGRKEGKFGRDKDRGDRDRVFTQSLLDMFVRSARTQRSGKWRIPSVCQSRTAILPHC